MSVQSCSPSPHPRKKGATNYVHEVEAKRKPSYCLYGTYLIYDTSGINLRCVLRFYFLHVREKCT